MPATALAISSDREIRIPAPLAHQVPIVESTARYKVVRAGRRGGKTVLAELCAIVGHGPVNALGEPLYSGIAGGRDVIWIARDYTQAGIMWHEFVRPRFRGVGGVRVNEADRTVTVLGAGTLFVVSAENIASARGMGRGLAGAVVEEAAWLDLQTALRDVLLPALLDNRGWLLLISTTNAGSDGNQAHETPSYFNRLCEEIARGERSEDWAEWSFTAEDNPAIDNDAFAELVAEYPPDSPQLRQEVYAELLRGGIGLALPDVRADRHVVPRFPVPPHWTQFGAFDWGYNHPYCFGWFAADEDGNVYLLDTIWGRQEQPDVWLAKIGMAAPIRGLRYIDCGHDLWHDLKARGESGPTLAERAQADGWNVRRATISRVSGLNNLRSYLSWRDADGVDRSPRFRMMDTDGNRRVLAQLQAMQLDPKDPEDALKIDADQAGRGGDDGYDMVRYGLMSRPALARLRPGPPGKIAHRALELKVEHGRLVKPEREPTTAAELVDWAERRQAKHGTRTPMRQRSPQWSKR